MNRYVPPGAKGAHVLPYKEFFPKLAEDVYIAPNSAIVGDVEIGAQSSVWFNCVVRGDDNFIRIGERTNIQDGTVVHVDSGEFPTIIGNDVLIGHMALIHACTLEDWSFIGMGATVMNGAVVESTAMVAAGSLVTPGKRVTAGQLWSGRPARPVRALTPEELEGNRYGIAHYLALAREFRGF